MTPSSNFMTNANRPILVQVKHVVRVGEAEGLRGIRLGDSYFPRTVHAHARNALGHDIFASLTHQSIHSTLALLVERNMLAGTEIEHAVMNLPSH